MNRIEEIKKEILKCLNNIGIKVKRIILFGSRAKGNASQYSDYDILIITEKTFSIEEKINIFEKVNSVLASLLIPSDIIIKSEKEVKYLNNKIGNVTRQAIKEGILI